MRSDSQFRDCMREVHTLRELCRKYELKNVKLTAKRDSIRAVIQQLSGNSNIDPMLTTTPPVPATLETHPGIRFWTLKDYKAWIDTPEAQVMDRGKEPYLEDKDGNAVSGKRLAEIRAAVRGAWAELVNWKLAPQVWGELSASGQHLFHSLMETRYPLFTYAEGHWKLERLACNSYSAWRINHLDEECNWKKRSISVKGESDDGVAVSLSRKRKGKAKAVNEERP
ncbi:hypothetical protein BDN67DRAFT_1059975 [Paxillus ammoniavirescens]|nr:hypothetical protein BDN67DRAFT_1059975 [Paxillus ammoniavirescens]